VNVGNQITVVIARLGSLAGGEATLKDFAIAALENDANVDVFVGSSSLRQRIGLRQQIRRSVPKSRRRLRVIASARVLDFKVSRGVHFSDFAGQPKLRPTAFRFLLDPRRVRAARSLRMSQLVLVSQVLTDAGATQLKLQAKEAKLVLNHNGDPESFYSKWAGSRFSDHSNGGKAYKEYLDAFDLFVFQSELQEQRFQQLHQEKRYRSLTIWPSCSEESARKFAVAPSPFAPGFTDLVCVAKFQPRKGQLELIRAMADIVEDFPDARLTFVGGVSADTGYLETCKQETEIRGLSGRVDFVGPRTDALAYTAHCDLFILVSQSEGVSRAVREAAFLAKPIVCSPLLGSLDFLTPEGAHYVARQDPKEISRVIALALRDKLASHRVGRRARQEYLAKSSWPVFRSEVRALLAN
jgi:glycosyltransferase involved in cell wall biosynthesis